MKTEAEIRRALREWVVRTSGRIEPEELTDGTPIIERRIVTSLKITDLLLFLEDLAGRAVEIEKLKPGMFRDIDAIYDNFFRRPHGA